jgi:hypothetical protein
MLAEADRRAKGNLSGYLQKLVALDLKNEPIDAMQENIMEELTRRLHGERYLARLKPLVAEVDQRDELAALLSSYIADRNEKPKHTHRMAER